MTLPHRKSVSLLFGRATPTVRRFTSLDTDEDDPSILDHSSPRASPAVGLEQLSSLGRITRQEAKYAQILDSTQPSEQTSRSWRAPIIMLVSLLLGLIFAVAHHEMNSHLNGTIVDSLGQGVSQQWISRYATAFVFLVRTSFVTCVGTAFIQRQWLNFSTRKQPITVQDFDTISSALTSILSIFSSVWLKHPLLLVLFLLSLTMPYSVVVVPASLSVALNPFPSTVFLTVPSPAYRTYNLYTQLDCCGQQGELVETPAVSKVAFETATRGQIVAMSPSYPNMTYTTTFTGPALRCQEANSTLAQNVTDTLHINDANDPDTMVFVSWTGAFGASLDLWQSTLSSWGCEPDPAIGCSIFVGSALGAGVSTDHPSQGLLNHNALVNVTECRLHNASYTINVEFQNNIQNTSVMNIEYLNAVWDPSNDDPINDYPPPFDLHMANSYLGIMSAFGNLLVGSADTSQYGYIKRQTHYDLLSIDWTDASAMTSGLQQLFENFTISMLASPGLLDNSTEPHPINVITWYNIYVYNSFELILPYGIAFLVSLACLIVGMHAVFASRNSYQNKFSSFVRAVNMTNLHGSITRGDDGADPLPTALGQKTFRLGREHDIV